MKPSLVEYAEAHMSVLRFIRYPPFEVCVLEVSSY